MQRVRWGALEDRREAEGGVEGDVEGRCEDGNGENAHGDECGRGSIFDHLGSDEPVSEQYPEEGGDYACVDRSQGDKCCRALLNHESP